MKVCKMCGKDFVEGTVSGDICPACLRDMTMTFIPCSYNETQSAIDWISVEDELPELGREVIAYWWYGSGHAYMVLRRVCGDERNVRGIGDVKVVWLDHEDYDGGDGGYPVTHWKYLFPPDCRNNELIEDARSLIVRFGWDPDKYPMMRVRDIFSEMLFINGLDEMCVQTDAWMEDLFEAFPTDRSPETYDEFSKYMLSGVNGRRK